MTICTDVARGCVIELTVIAEVGADLFNFGLTVYSTNAKAGPAPRAL